MRIGYSFWGFLGDGIVDTPDGGRSHRRAWVQGLAEAGHDVVFLQKDRDRLEAGHASPRTLLWDLGFPEINLLFLEWRWVIPGRNDEASRATPGWTPDLDRQRELIAHYTLARKTPTLIWDKDLRLSPAHRLRRLRHVVVAEAALFPRAGAWSLLFPVHDQRLAEGMGKIPLAHPLRDLVYIGNQYGRNRAFTQFVAQPAKRVSHAVFGKWTSTLRWPHVRFHGRIPFSRVGVEHAASLATPAIVPDRYAACGQMTQRLAEAALAGCVPLVASEVRGCRRMAGDEAIVDSARDVESAVRAFERDEARRADALVEALSRLDEWRLSRQIDRFTAMSAHVGAR